MDIAAELQSVMALKKVAPEALTASVPLWSWRKIWAGQNLWSEGEPARDLAILATGELHVLVSGQNLARVRAREMVGEATAVTPGAMRSATLRAAEPVDVLLLPLDRIPTIRSHHPALYDALLDMALGAITRRIRATDVQIAKISQGLVPMPTQVGPEARAFSRVSMNEPPLACPPLRPLLERLPLLANRPAAVYAVLEVTCTPRFLRVGETVFQEGEWGDAAYVLAAGEIHVMRAVRNRRADVLARLKPGELFGTLTLVNPGHRTATCMAPLPGWVYRLTAEAYRTLPAQVRQAWNESMLVSMSLQMRNANQVLARMMIGQKGGGPLPDKDLDALLRAAGAALEGGRGPTEGSR